MSLHHAKLRWSRGSAAFTYEAYPRDHEIFLGKATIKSSAAPEYRGDAALPNPEEMLVGALSSCHMLSFLAIAARKRLSVDAYEDHAEGVLEKNGEGRLAITSCVLHPRVRFSESTKVERAVLEELHHEAHHTCFIATSVKTEVTFTLDDI